ncbi:MAG TPA: CDP-alcohol phosphatidyltransferase family protein [Verrucomicrobia bacterium]|nr:CDP-alcohol phosphatidyltransferase family protein [Verrucomicrobiales bacterium]HIL55070.1 CDP-alcohol phosphatidyltransferase family protein [Verrucomicrobiota bacterium]
MTIPTRITLARLIMSPVFVVLAIKYSSTITLGKPDVLFLYLAMIVFAMAVISDALDGYLARKLNQRSRIGSFLDPIADKTLLLSATITLTFIDCGKLIPIFYTTLILSRELIQISGAIAIGTILGDIKVKHHWTGKFSTFMQVILIYSAFLVPSESIMLYLSIVGGLFIFISAALYIYAGLSQLPKEAHANP